jgi:quercetin dioxygenase-like cupin family protein
MTKDDRRIVATESDFIAAGSIPIEAVSALEGARETGGIGIRPVMVGAETMLMEVHRKKGLIDPEHSHDDHESICYLLSGRMRVVIAGETFIAEPGDTWIHRAGVLHYHETLEDSVQLEVKSPPRKPWS